MSYMDEYNKLEKKRLQEEAKASAKKSGANSYMNEYNKLRGRGNFLPLVRSSFISSVPLSKKEKDEEPKTKKEKEKEEEDDSKLDFFQKGAFDDGYQRWDVSKAILGTVGDAGLSVVKGLGRLGEGVGDLVSYGIAGVADLVGKDEFAENVKKRTQDSFVDLLFEDTTERVNKNSVLGRTSDAILEGIGQVGGIMATGGLGSAAGLSSAGVTALTSTTMGLSGMGSGMGEAYKGGATDWEALKHGLNVGATDAISELIFGGLGKTINAIGFNKGLSSADDILAKALSNNVKNQITKNIVEFGVKSGAEGLEEVIAGIAQAWSKHNTYMSEDEFLDILKDENLLEQFVVGSLTSGIAQAPSLHVSNTTKTDFVTGRTQNEQAVVDKEVENRIAEKEKDGTKLTAKEKSTITAQVEKDLEKGYISTDTIESVLGGENYESYKSLTEQETAIKDEIETLENTPENQFTVKQRERLTELREQLEGIDTKTAKSNLFSEVDKLTANDTKLRESYNEKARRGQNFEADLTKYDTKQQETIKKAIDSGILNNTNRTHEFVDLVAKISADKGVPFDFTNNQKLKESGFAIDGKQVNGFVTKDGITVNVNSAKSLDTVVGHEITHVLEGTELYNELQTAIVEYAKSKGDYQGRYDTLAKLYENVEGANIDSELTAELVGDYIFTDTDFIHNLSTNNRNVFQKVYDEIKYLYKVATAGSKEARELERVKKLFDEAYRNSKNAEITGTKYSISGVNAKTADNSLLMKAENMLSEGVDSETVRKDTGWYKGYDGKWRYEVDDSKMEVLKNLTSPQFAKYKDGEALKLGEVIKHDALFDAYPELRDLSVQLKTTLGKNVVGSYAADTDTLYVSGSIYMTNDMVKEMLIHEIQHKIQNMEGFARGSSPKYWETKGIGEDEYERFVANSEREKARILKGLSSEEQQDYLRYVETDKQIQEAIDKIDTSAILRGEDADAMEALRAVESIEKENDALYKKLYSTDWFTKLQDIDNVLNEGVSENLYTVFYKNTAGEIEARDVAKRVNYTNEQRQNIRPDIDRANVTFAKKGDSLAYIGDTKDGRRAYRSGFGDDVSMDDRIAEFKNRIATIFNLGAVELKTDVKKIRIRGDKFTAQKNLYGDPVARDGEKEARVNSLYDLADILATSKYDPSATAKEPSYANPAQKPKNKAHDGVKYWYKFRNEIVFDGVPYTVTFNIRDKGGEQYQYLIEFKENKTPGLSNTAVKSLLRTDQMSYDDTLSPISGNVNSQLSLSENGATPAGKFLGKDMALETAPVAEAVEADVAPTPATISNEETVEDYAHGESLEEQLAKADESLESLDTETEVLFRDLSEQKITEEEFAQKWHDLDQRYTQARNEQERISAEMTDINNRKYESLDDSDIPPETEAPYYGEAESVAPVDPFAQRDMTDVGKRNVKAYMNEHPEVTPFFQDAARGMLYDLQNGTKGERIFNEQMHYESGYEKGWMGTSRRTTGDIADLLDQWGYSYAQIEAGLNAIIEGGGKENNAVSKRIEFMLDNRLRNGYKDVDGRPIPADDGYINLLKEMQIDEYHSESFDSFMEVADQYAPPAEDIAPVKTEPAAEVEQNTLEGFEQTEQEPERLTRAKLHSQIVDSIKAEFNRKGLDFDEVLKNAHRMNALSINDNTPQRVNDKTFGYEAGEALNEVTFNRVALRESNGVKWLNKQVDTIRNLSKKYKIKPLSKESAAAQMYAEGFWVNDKDEIIAYGDAELAQDFPDVSVQNRIKALASDPTIRKIYDDTLTAINESRTRNAYPEIPRLENYYLHFRAMDDTFSRLGVPFNPNDIKAKDLPTDINGTTIDRKPGQPFFASSMHREGKRTSFDLFGGLEKYLNSAKNQIYHIDDIQTARALWGYIADRYGQAHGLENLDQMAYEAQAEHIQQVYDGHLSNYARFLVEYANHLAGKTALIDRGVEGLIGRRALQFINTVNMQTSRNQVGFSVSSPLTNLIPSMEAIARSDIRDSIKALAQTVSNKFRKDGFVENDLTLIRRRGANRFSKTAWDKASDLGFAFMGLIDNVTSEFIVRTKYNELTRKGMDSAQAHIKAGEWASRIMGDRSLGQMPLHYNSKFMGLFTKYQLEVRNALDSQFYDTFQEAKANTKEFENQKAKTALTVAKYTYKIAAISFMNHIFGQAFEKIVGYNPAFDIISTIATLFGLDDDDEEDTFADNAEQAFKELLGDLPYTSMFTENGRIPIGSALPIKQLVSGVDKYGNEKSRWETLLEAAPYYLLPGGYGQIKKSAQGLGMFSDEHPISGSYTDSGNLRYPVEKTFGNVLQAGVFGQYASENARDYFDNERSPLKAKQIQEFIDVDIPIKDYWEYRDGLSDIAPLPGKSSVTLNQKGDYIGGLDLPVSKKNILINNIADRDTPIDMSTYDNYRNFEEFDFAQRYPEKYAVLQDQGISVEEYKANKEETAFLYTDDYSWAANNPDKYVLSKAITDDVQEYKRYTSELAAIESDKNENGDSINGSRKDKVFAYIESLPLDYGQKCILFKSQYKADDSMNMDIIEYLDIREDIDYEAMVTILKELDFIVEGNNVYWD